MIFSDLRYTRFWLQMVDAFLTCAAMVLAYWIRVHLLPGLLPLESKSIGNFSIYIPYAVILGLLTPIVLERRGVYRHLSVRQRDILAPMIETSLILFLIAISLIFFLKESPSRLVFMFFVPLLALFLACREHLFRRLGQHRQKSGNYSTHILLVSDSEKGSTDWTRLLAESASAVQVAHLMHPEKNTLEEFIHILHEKSAGIVLFEIKPAHLPWAAKAIQACEEEGIEAWLSTSFAGTQIAHAHLEEILGRNLLVFRTTLAGTWQSVIKVIFDRLISTILLLLLSPVLALIWVAIRLESSGSAIFCQKRSGRHGAPFTMYKFRTMHTNAEMQQVELKALNEMSGPVFKIKNDPRITKVGAFLRFTSLDELPQLFNVWFGQMSLVGPRPLPTYETLAMTANAQRRRLSVSPGMTCLWQISGRNEVKDFSDWVRLDLEYIDRWSLWLDFQILLRTIPAVLFGRGAR